MARNSRRSDLGDAGAKVAPNPYSEGYRDRLQFPEAPPQPGSDDTRAGSPDRPTVQRRLGRSHHLGDGLSDALSDEASRAARDGMILTSILRENDRCPPAIGGHGSTV